MNERKINLEDAAIFRIQAIVENTLTIQIEILSHLSGKPFQEISDHVWSNINRDMKELIQMHSKLGDEPTAN